MGVALAIAFDQLIELIMIRMPEIAPCADDCTFRYQKHGTDSAELNLAYDVDKGVWIVGSGVGAPVFARVSRLGLQRCR